LSLNPAGTVSTRSPYKCKAKRDIPCEICGEESATAASFLTMFLISPISVNPTSPTLTHQSLSSQHAPHSLAYHCHHNIRHTHSPITVIPTCPTLTRLSLSSQHTPHSLNNHCHPNMPHTHSTITVIPTCPTLTHLSLSSQHVPHSLISHQRYTAADGVLR